MPGAFCRSSIDSKSSEIVPLVRELASPHRMELIQILNYSAAVFAAAITVAVWFHERRALPQWLLCGGVILLGLESLFSGLAADALLPQDVVYWQKWKFFCISVLPGLWLPFSLAYSRGNARDNLRKWRYFLLGFVLLPIGLCSGILGEVLVSVSRKNTAAPWVLNLGLPGVLLNLSLVIAAVLILTNLERTYRASVGVMRWRIKFLLLGAGVLWTIRAYTSSESILFRAEGPHLQAFNASALLAACFLLMRSLTRNGRFEVRVYPSSAVLHGSLTLIMAGAYLVAVGAFFKFTNSRAGNWAFEAKTLLLLASLVFLAVLLLSEKARSSTKRFISRHFHRPLYDYRAIWRNFTEGTARRLEQTELSDAVAKLVSHTFQAMSVTIWLVDDSREKLVFAASTSLSHAKAAQLDLDRTDFSLLLEGARNHPEPIDIDSSKAIWAVLARRLQQDEFRKGGNRICVPMTSGSELLGVLMLGDRVNGEPFWPQDFDLLKTLADQAAASLLNIQLSQKLLQTRQVEAFQTMSTFFVHDLKNTASTLSLMLQNLPVHFNDPAFRDDALRGVSRTVAHINDLIGRLSLLRRDLAAQPVEADLNDLVTSALNRVEDVPSINLARDLRPLPRIRVDPTQIENVVTNLLLNARDAVRSGGRIRVETGRQNGCVVLSVSDNGCGMTPEFIKHSLFRPFQTTKPRGIGVGMFQCKTIVEAHRGRIEVDSEIGKGTVFRVLLPAPT
jgi:putative PEP-CTERM system histidine kinase